ncbi:membrane protein [Streptomyces sulfonofaciens]|uniref:Membrane protein n=1 Tax=Streptomyces sulfonofaciens TaxID=68272 RepID=A0A919FNF7_9ACTN|nr:membrane protein [Streptomyces sulfonofaciens]
MGTGRTGGGAVDGAGTAPGPGGAVPAGPGPVADGGAVRARTPLPAVAMVVGAAVSVQLGAALAVRLMPRTGPSGVVALRLAVSAAVLLAVCRPRLRGHTRADWGTVVVFGVVTGLMNNLFYQAAARVPLGIAVTLEVLGPLALSVLASRRLINLLWAALALTGVVLLGVTGGSRAQSAVGGTGSGGLDPVGVAFGLGAGVMWALYIVFSVRTGRRFPQADGLALAMAVAALLSLPLGVAAAGPRLVVPSTVGLGAAVAMLSTVLPYTLELVALRRLPAATVAVLMTLEPAIAALAGFLVLRQALSATDALAVAMVIAAGMGAVRTRAVRQRPPRCGKRPGVRDA